jgi:periodic tryptophan protein 1
MAHLISAVAWVRRGVAAEYPSKYTIDEKELERVSALARVELEDARVELERVSELAKTMGQGIEEGDEEEGWEE